MIRYIDGTSTLYSAVLSLSEWGEESAGRIILDLLRLEGRLTILQVIQGLDKAQAVWGTDPALPGEGFDRLRRALLGSGFLSRPVPFADCVDNRLAEEVAASG